MPRRSRLSVVVIYGGCLVHGVFGDIYLRILGIRVICRRLVKGFGANLPYSLALGSSEFPVERFRNQRSQRTACVYFPQTILQLLIDEQRICIEILNCSMQGFRIIILIDSKPTILLRSVHPYSPEHYGGEQEGCRNFLASNFVVPFPSSKDQPETSPSPPLPFVTPMPPPNLMIQLAYGTGKVPQKPPAHALYPMLLRELVHLALREEDDMV